MVDEILQNLAQRLKCDFMVSVCWVSEADGLAYRIQHDQSMTFQ